MSAYAVSARGLVSRRIPQGVLAPMNALLFGLGEQGAWYDPSDLSTLFQDAAGTVPVTAMEQPVGLMLDLSGNGNHASQGTTTKRGVVSRRVNLHGFNTSTFSGTILLKAGTGVTPIVTPNYANAPDGSNTAVRVQLDCGSGTTSNDYSIVGGLLHSGESQIVGGAYTSYIWMRAVSGNQSVGFVGAGPVVTAYNLTETWTKVTKAEVGSATTFSLRILTSGAIPEQRGPKDILVWQPQLSLAIDSHLPYQWVNADGDYDADPNKFPTYLRFDGVDDGYQTGSIDFTGTDKMTVWAGVTKLSDAAAGVLLELSPSVASNNGTINVLTPASAASNIQVTSKGTLAAFPIYANSSIAAPVNLPMSVISSISGDSIVARLGGVAVASSASDQGTGNYGNYPLYIGGRAGSSLFFNGRLYQLIVRGAQSSLSQIEAVENIIRKTMRLP